MENQLFNQLDQLKWEEAFFDDGKGDCRQRWFVDGERATIRNTPEGMVFAAGPIEGDHASHSVLWTRKSFTGDIKIEYDFTRIDTIEKYVNILYIQATGIGPEPYAADISQWTYLRTIPYMDTYYRHMNLLHLSYAAHGKGDAHYLRARRYPLAGDQSFSELAISPDYEDPGLFLPGVTCNMTVIKHGHNLLLRVTCAGNASYFQWDTSGFPPVTEGRIGLRHMWTRCSRYKDFRISTLKTAKPSKTE